MGLMDRVCEDVGRRLWKACPFLPSSARLLGTRLRPIFEAHALHSRPEGEFAAAADALAFAEFALRQDRIALFAQQAAALRRDARRIRRQRLLRWLGL